jgi:hypothetical protein
MDATRIQGHVHMDTCPRACGHTAPCVSIHSYGYIGNIRIYISIEVLSAPWPRVKQSDSALEDYLACKGFEF